MSKISLGLVGVVVVIVTAMLTPSVIVRAQGSARFEYVRVTSYTVRDTLPGGQVRSGFRACIASTQAWNCREFPPMESSDSGFRNALATLGNEGWELVAVVVEQPTNPVDLTYLFKRRRR
jgi:hypothetical protein